MGTERSVKQQRKTIQNQIDKHKLNDKLRESAENKMRVFLVKNKLKK